MIITKIINTFFTLPLAKNYLSKLNGDSFHPFCIHGQKIYSSVMRCLFKVNIARLLVQTVLYSLIHCLDSGWQNFLAWCSLFQIPLWYLPVLTMYKNLGFYCCPQSQRKLVCWTLPFPSTHDKFLHRPIFLKKSHFKKITLRYKYRYKAVFVRVWLINIKGHSIITCTSQSSSGSKYRKNVFSFRSGQVYSIRKILITIPGDGTWNESSQASER